MSIILNLPLDAETALIEQAEAQGIDVDTYVQMLLQSAPRREVPTIPLPEVGVRSETGEQARERIRATFEDLMRQAEELEPMPPPSDTTPKESDACLEILKSKLRKQGFRLP